MIVQDKKGEPQFTIAAVERDTGLSKDVLRVWERRYGFPAPGRDAHGERLYPAGQVVRLRLIKRLMDQGHRPGRLMASSAEELQALAQPEPAAAAVAPARSVDQALDKLLSLLRQHASGDFQQALQQQLAREGLRLFVQDTVAPLAVQVGLAWEQGRLHIFEEHLFSELTMRVLRQAIAAVPGGTQPRVLLTTLPREPHALGLLMVEALLALEGAHCITLGTQTPLLEIVEAAAAHRADVVGLSFSAAFPAREAAALLSQLRAALPAATALWAGGSGVRKLAPCDGVVRVAALDDAASAVAAWKAAHG